MHGILPEDLGVAKVGAVPVVGGRGTGGLSYEGSGKYS